MWRKLKNLFKKKPKLSEDQIRRLKKEKRPKN